MSEPDASIDFIDEIKALQRTTIATPVRASVEKRMIEYGLNAISSLNGACRMFIPSIEQAIRTLGVSRSSSYRVFPSIESYETRLLCALPSLPSLYATAVLSQVLTTATNQAALSKATMGRQELIELTGVALVITPNHVLAARVEALIASHDQIERSVSDATKELVRMQTIHTDMLAAHLQMAHALYGEVFTFDTARRYARSMMDAARGFALSPFNSDTSIRATVFNTIAESYLTSSNPI